MKSVYIIILLYNGKKWIDNCFNSVLATQYPNFKLLVIDNASTDGSADYIAFRYPQLTLIRNKKNHGFAEGNNIGMRYAFQNGADYVFLLNQDTTIESTLISKLVDIAACDSKIGIVSPIQYDYQGKDIDKSCYYNLSINPQFVADYNAKRLRDIYIVDIVVGAAMFITKDLSNTIGLFDPLYFLYGEETDFCQRAKYRGYKTAIITAGKVCHWHASLQDDFINRRAFFWYIRGSALYNLKNPNRNIFVNLFSASLFIYRKIKNLRSPICIYRILYIYFTLILCLPLIIYKRNKEKYIVCYYS